MIKLTKRSGDNAVLSPEHIISILGNEKADVFTLEDCYQVNESPEEVAKKVLEYKIAMMDYKILYAHDESVFHVEEKLQRLAGIDHLVDA